MASIRPLRVTFIFKVSNEDKAMRVLIAIDGSEYSEAAVTEAATRVWPTNSEIRLITACPLSPAPMGEIWALPPDYFEKLDRVTREHAWAVQDAAKLKLTRSLDPSIKITGNIFTGAPRLVILEEAERWKADLIIVGSHGYGALQRFLLGSVSQAVVSHAKCSVEVVRRPDPVGAKEVKAA